MILSELGIVGYLISSATEGAHGGFDWVYVAQHTVNLAILIGVLVYFAKDPVRDFLKERRKNLGREFDEAQKTIDEAKKRHEEYTQKLNNLESEIASLKDSIQKQGEAEKNEILEHASATAEAILKESRDNMKLEANKIKKELQNDIISSSLREAEEIISKHLTEKESHDSVDQFVRKVEEEKWLQ